MAVQNRQRVYRFRCYPTVEQEQNLARTLGCVRLVFNKALDARNKSWFRRRERTTYAQTSALLTKWKRRQDLAFLNEVSSVPLQQSLRHLQKAFVNFWERRAAYPVFKRKRFCGAAEYTRSAFTWTNGDLKLAKHAEPLEIRWSRRLPVGAEPTTVTVSRDAAGRWFVSLLVEEPIPALPVSNENIGVDAGLNALFAFSTGELVTNPRPERRDRERVRKLQRELSRKRKGSANWCKARLRLARARVRVADRRQDLLHKLSTRLIRENQVICVEDLNVRGMLRNRRLAGAIADASWSSFREMLEYKAEWYGRSLIVVDRFLPSSKTCSECGALRGGVKLGQRTFNCPDPSCGHAEDRDINAAKNILAAGLAVAACGDGVRPKRA